jgi:PPOX class probable F420-dependent enzyme
VELPEDVIRWVSLHFKESEVEAALNRLRAAEIHTGEPASPRLLRCVALTSRGNLRLLDQSIRELGRDFRDVIIAAEYKVEAGHSIRVNDLSHPMNEIRSIPNAIAGQKYISLTTFRKTGAGVATPVWFGEDGNKLYVMTRSDMGKTKRIRNNAQVKVAPSSIRGKVTGPEFAATVRILPPAEHQHARDTINRKYWMARIPLIWSRTDTYFEISFP